MSKAGTITTISIAAIMAASSAAAEDTFTDIETTPGFNDKIEEIVMSACPDPTPSANTLDEIMGYKACIDGAGLGMNKIAVEVSNYITDNRLNLNMMLSGIENHGALVECNTALKESFVEDRLFTPTIPNLNEYGNDRINAIRLCIGKVDVVQQNTAHWYNQAAQNAVITQINCLLTPDTCERPVQSPKNNGPTVNII